MFKMQLTVSKHSSVHVAVVKREEKKVSTREH